MFRGQTQTLTGLELDSRYRVREGIAAADRVERPRFALGAEAKARADARALALASE